MPKNSNASDGILSAHKEAKMEEGRPSHQDTIVSTTQAGQNEDLFEISKESVLEAEKENSLTDSQNNFSKWNTTKNQNCGKDFTPGENSTRPDVVRKSIIRGVKRFFCDQMCEGNPLIYSASSPEGLKCLSTIDEFWDKHFLDGFEIPPTYIILPTESLISGKKKVDPKSIPEPLKEFYKLKITLACMNLSIPMKKKFSYPFVKTCYSLVYEVLYKYSNKKLMKLINFPAFSKIFEHLHKSGVLEEMIQENQTFKANEDIYRKNIQALWEKVNKA